ncbi:MAG: hypothetical protein ACRCXX_11755 [Cetobacterium sp.]|uniref:hypothetical protein n=1 Tax=Cetobacterium sp. TaxID=2071632 RepID=UPI003F3AFD3E
MEQVLRILKFIRLLGILESQKSDEVLKFEIEECVCRCCSYIGNKEFPEQAERSLAKTMVQAYNLPMENVESIKEGDTSIKFLDDSGFMKILKVMISVLIPFRKPFQLGKMK